MRQSPRRHRTFTLVEVLVAMAVLSVMLTFLFMIIRSTQQVWEHQRSRIEVQRNASLFFDLVRRDLQSLRASTSPEIMWTTDVPSPSFAFACVSASGIGTTDSNDVNLIEVAYQLDPSGSDPGIYRWMSTDVDSGAEWDCIGTDTATWTASNSWSDSDLVVSGVHAFEMTAYNRDDEEIEVDSPRALFLRPPAYVEVTAELIDPGHADLAEDNPLRLRSLRRFTKRIYIGRNTD